METVEQTHDRTTAILKEFSIPEEMLRVLGPNERPLHHSGQRSYSDGHYYTHNVTKISSYYRATYCVHATRSFEVVSVEVRQDFDAEKLHNTLKIFRDTRNTVERLVAREARPQS